VSRFESATYNFDYWGLQLQQPYRGALRSLGVPHADRLLKDNFALDTDLLHTVCLCMNPLCKNTTPELLHSFPGYLFHRTIVFSGLIAEQFKSADQGDLHLRNSRQLAPVDLHLCGILTYFLYTIMVFFTSLSSLA
jgi:hypothetical protein